MVATAGGVSPLVALLKDGLNDGRVEAQEYALWSLSLATDANSRMTIAKDGGIGPLVQSMKTGELSNKAQEDASCVLASLAKDVDNRDEITDPQNSGIPPLVALLSGDSNTGAKKNAATALGGLRSTGPPSNVQSQRQAQSPPSSNGSRSNGQCLACQSWRRALSLMLHQRTQNCPAGRQCRSSASVMAMLENGRGNDAQKSASGHSRR